MKYLAVLALLVACSPGKPTVSPVASSEKIRVFYHNDNVGYLEPCGCRVSPIGGMDRRWNAMKAYPDQSRVFVDAGNLLFKSTTTTEFLAPQWYEQALGVIEAYNLLGADAVTVGASDFALGVAKLQELSKHARFPFLSANIYWKGTAKLLLRDSIIIERYGKKIGIFGVFHPSLPLPGELEAKDPVGHAKAMVEKLRKQGAEMVIALSHQGFDYDQEMAKAVPGIDLLVGAHSQSLLQSPVMEGSTLLVQLSSQGQILGMVEYEAGNLPKRSDFVVAELDNNYKDAPRGMANPMKNLVAVTNLRIGEANRKLDAKIWAKQDGRALGYQTFLSCRDCHGKQAEFQEGQLHSAAFLTLLAKKQENNMDCVKCHSVGMGEKGGFRVLKEAFLDQSGRPVPLEKIREIAGKEFPKEHYRGNPHKIRSDVAHWVGAMKKAGVKKSFVSVQCESCHGGRPEHPFGTDGSTGKVVANACLQCHTKEQMPAWYDGAGKLKQETLQAAIQAVTCPK